MARLILKSPYLKGNKTGQAAKYLKYIATREGVEFVPETKKHLPATKKQKELIESLVEIMPDSKELYEYKDYCSTPTRDNASNFIETAVELAEGSFENREKYVQYIAERPRAEKIGSHGLFTDDDKPVILAEAVEEVKNSKSNVWGHIISLCREDAERLGYNNANAWMQLLRSQRNYIAEQMHIDPKNFRWYAAFHNEGHHPHVHLIAYSVKPREAFLTRTGIENIKSALAKEIFRQERISIYQQQTQYRDEVKEESKALVSDFIKKINTGILDKPEIENLLIRLSEKLKNYSGKKQYGYLPKYAKDIVNAIVDEIEKDERIDRLYEEWYQKQIEVISFYTDSPPEREPLSQNKVFKSIKNMIISEAMNILSETESERYLGEGIIQSDVDDNVSTDAEDTYTKLLNKAKKGNQWDEYRLAKYLIDESSPHYNPDEAVRWFMNCASKGNPIAQYYLGKMYYRGIGVPKDLKKAVFFLNQAGKNNNQYALYLLGKIFSTEEDAMDMEKAIRCYRLSAKYGNTFAEYQLGRIYLYGNGVDKNYYQAIEYLTLAASKGNQYAAQLLYAAERHRNAFASIGGLSIFKSIARAIQESHREQERRNRLARQNDYVDSKTRQKVNEKKHAHGLKPNM